MEWKEEEEEEGKNRLQSYSPAALLGRTSASIRSFAAFSLFRKKVVMVLMLLKFYTLFGRWLQLCGIPLTP